MKHLITSSMNASPAWAVLTVWGVVNALNLLQAIGFLSRTPGSDMTTNRAIGYVIMILAIPATIALVSLVRTGSPVLDWVGPATFLAFIALMIAVDYVHPVEFRSPKRYAILVPYLILFFGSILLMGLPMFRLNHRLWLITVATTIVLLGTMGVAMRRGVG